MRTGGQQYGFRPSGFVFGASNRESVASFKTPGNRCCWWPTDTRRSERSDPGRRV